MTFRLSWRMESVLNPCRLGKFLGWLWLTTCVGILHSRAQTSGVYREVYSGIGGVAVADLTNAAAFPNSPSSTGYLTNNFEAPINVADNYGQRCRALITAPTTGNYIFWISSDDASELWLGTDETPASRNLIANVAAWTNSREWTKEPNQQSAPKALVAGQRYYLEALMKEGGGGDNLAVRWQLPGGTIEEPIPATRLTPFTGAATVPPTITQQPTNTTVQEGLTATFKVSVSNQDPISYQWQRNSNNIAGASGPSYTTSALSMTNNGNRYRCFLTNVLGATFSSNAVLTVVPDTTPPSILSVANLGDNSVRIVFSEKVQAASAANAANYVITNASGLLGIAGAAFGANSDSILLSTASQQPWSTYTITVNAVRNASPQTNLIAPNSQAVFTNLIFTRGYIRRDLFFGIAGNPVSALTGSPNFPNNPDTTDYPSGMGWPSENINNNYGGRFTGYLVPPTNGSYTFAIRSDDASQLFLSPDEQATNKVMLTREDGCCNPFDTHVSASMTLAAGQRHYIEALMKEGVGGDYLYVAWKSPMDPVNWTVIPGTYLGNYLAPSNSTVTITQQPTNTTTVSGQSATFVVAGAGVSDMTTNLTYQWQKDGVDIAGADGASYTAPLVFETNSVAAYRVLVSVPGKTATSSNAILTVVPDTFPPTITSAKNIGPTNVIVLFSEAVEAATATNRLNYTFANGLTLSAVVFGGNTHTVVLTCSPLVFGSNYTLFVSNVRDRAAAPNTIIANSPVTFSAIEYTPQDVGSPALGGASTVVANGLDLTAGGSDIGGGADQFHFDYKQRTGDFDVKVRVAALGLSDVWAKAGLMARETLDPNSRFAASLATPSISGAFFQFRDPAGAISTVIGSFPVNGDNTWLRLQRSGNQFNSFARFDGQTWTLLGSASIAMSNAVYFGLALTSHNVNQATAAQFRDFADVTGAVIGASSNPAEPLGPSSRKTGLILSEIMYKPAPRPDLKNLEYVELFNSSPIFEDISGYRVSGDIDFTFPPGTVLPAGGFLVVAKVPADLQSVYGLNNVMGPYANSLKKSGTVRLRNNHDAILLEVNYSNKPPWPVAADGTGHSLVLARPSYGEVDPHAWAISDSVGGSPGSINPFHPAPARAVVINEFLAHTDPRLADYLELYNHNAQAVDLSGTFLSDDAATNKYRIPDGTIIPARGFLSFSETNLGLSLSAAGETIFFVNSNQTRVLDAVTFEAQANGVSSGRWPDGAGDFYPLAARTPGASNSSILISDVVINEIMYAPISGDSNDQYVELYNKGSNAIVLANWKFTAGISFTFPTNSVLPSGGYLVIANNITNLLTKYPTLKSNNTLGNFSGSLSGGGERLALARPDDVVSTNSSGGFKTNKIDIVVDEVTYGTGGRWGHWAKDGGSSLELIDPRSNHRLARNWADSDDTAKSTWTLIQTTGVLDNGATYNGTPIDRLKVTLLGEGSTRLIHRPSSGRSATRPYPRTPFSASSSARRTMTSRCRH